MLLVSLDDRPLSDSRRILVQVGTTARPSGWHTEPAAVKPSKWKNSVPGEHILEVGHGPWLVEATQVSVSVASPHLTHANLLDPGGAVRAVRCERNQERCRLTLFPDTMHAVLYGK